MTTKVLVKNLVNNNNKLIASKKYSNQELRKWKKQILLTQSNKKKIFNLKNDIVPLWLYYFLYIYFIIIFN